MADELVFYGINPVFESLRSERLPSRIFLAEGKDANPRLRKLVQLAGQRGVPVETVRHPEAICHSPDHQGVCASAANLAPQPLEALPADATRLVMLDGLQDPQNFGAALRVCDSFGFPHVLFHEGDSCGVTPAAIKASAGALFHVRLYESNVNRAIKFLKTAGYTLIVMEADAPKALWELELPPAFCVVVGSEGRGVRHLVRQHSDLQGRIPLRGKVTSLNVSCALSVALYEFARRGP